MKERDPKAQPASPRPGTRSQDPPEEPTGPKGDRSVPPPSDISESGSHESKWAVESD